MKKMLILAAVAMLTVGSLGCQNHRCWWRRGAACNPCVETYQEPCCNGAAATIQPGLEALPPGAVLESTTPGPG